MFHSNTSNQAHCLLSCYPVSFKKHLKLNIMSGNQGAESGNQEVEPDVGVVNESTGYNIQPGTSVDVQLILTPKYV